MNMSYTPHLMRCEEWESNGYWHCADTSDLVHGSSMWWLPCRLLGISPADFVKLLINKFNCTKIIWEPDTYTGNGVLLYYWNNQTNMRKFKNYINKVARDKKFFI